MSTHPNRHDGGGNGQTGWIAIVTGAARGLGAAAAVRLAAEGAQVGILDIRDAAATRDQIRAAGGVCEVWLCDVTDEVQVVAAFQAIEERFGGVDILVNNAGILQPPTPALEMSKADVERYVQVNYIGYFLVIEAAYPLLKRSQHARIINVASRPTSSAIPARWPMWPARARCWA